MKPNNPGHSGYGCHAAFIACMMTASMTISANAAETVWSAPNNATSGIEAPSQKTVKISGTVTDAEGEPIIGASVIGEGGGTMTDINGQFTLTVPVGSKVSITYIGYLKETITVTGAETYNIRLKQALTDLDEVVVVGYGTKKKIDLTGSVAAIDGKEIKNTPVASISNAIAGRMPGVIAVNSSGAPGSGSSLSIRGASTLNDNSPLIVVDGVPRESFDRFDPQEIESITVLKDGASAAIYGARANNGVFLITTKRGVKEKMNITYSGTLSIQKPTMYPEISSAYEYALATNQALDNEGYDRTNPGHTSRYYSDEQIARFKSGEEGCNWYDESFKKTSLMQNHNVAVRGGSDNLKYFVSLGLVDQDGMYDNINYKAYKFLSNADIRLAKTLTLGVNLEGRQEHTKTPAVGAGTLFQHASNALPVYKAYYPDGRPFNTAGEHVVEEIRHSGYSKVLYNTFQGSVNLRWDLGGVTKGLSATSNFSYGLYYDSSKSFSTPYTIYTEDADGNIIGSKTNGGYGGKVGLSQSFGHYYTTFVNVGLNYQRLFNEKHDVNALIVYEQSGGKSDSFSGSKQDFATSKKDELFASGPVNQSLTGSSGIRDARRSYVGRVGYTFDNRYLLEASLRVDGSYKFPKNKRFGYFPAVSGAWRVSQESFFRDSRAAGWLSNLKLRASYAQVGNDKVGAFQYEDSYTISSSDGPFFNNEAQTLIYYGVFPNAAITWETADNLNFGIDAEMFNNRFGIELDYFIKNTRDILWSRSRSVPATFGRSLPNENYAKMRNSGFEVTLSHTNHIGNVGYNLRFTGSYAKNKVTQIDDPANAVDYQKQINRPLGFRAGYKSLGLFQSKEEADSWMGGSQFGIKNLPGDIKYADIDDNGVIDSRDQTVLSENNNTPRIMFGLSGSADWKRFDFSFLLQGAAERNILLSGTSRTGYQYAYLLDAWSPENTDAKYPLLWRGSRPMNDRTSDFWIKDASYLRLKTLTIGYTIPAINLKGWNINSIRIYFSGQNLLTFSGLDGFDPEAGAGNGAYYPQQKLYSFGLNVNF